MHQLDLSGVHKFESKVHVLNVGSCFLQKPYATVLNDGLISEHPPGCNLEHREKQESGCAVLLGGEAVWAGAQMRPVGLSPSPEYLHCPGSPLTQSSVLSPALTMAQPAHTFRAVMCL